MGANATKFWGKLDLDKIKAAIDDGVKPFKGAKGNYIDVNVWVNEKPDQYGNRLSIQIYNKDTKNAFYLGNLKESDFANKDQPVKASGDSSSDLPF